WDGGCLNERPPHIVFSPDIKKKVAEIVGDETNPLIKVRKIFHWIDANIRYHAEQEYSTIPSFSVACLSRHKGDCGVQSILFITIDYGRELVPPKQSMRSEPADFQVGEIELDGRNLFYDEWDYDMTIEWLTDEKDEG